MMYRIDNSRRILRNIPYVEVYLGEAYLNLSFHTIMLGVYWCFYNIVDVAGQWLGATAKCGEIAFWRGGGLGRGPS